MQQEAVGVVSEHACLSHSAQLLQLLLLDAGLTVSHGSVGTRGDAGMRGMWGDPAAHAPALAWCRHVLFS